MKIKENEKRDNYLDLAREPKKKKLWSMRVTVIPTVIGALGMVRDLEELEIGGRADTILTTAWLRSARILRRVLETCCHLDPSERPSANGGVKNSLEERGQP